MSSWNTEIPKAEWYDKDSPGLGALIQEVADQKRIAIDTETTGLNVWKDVPLFWSASWGERRVCLPADTLPLFREAFANKNTHWYFANAKYDMHILANYGIHILGKLVDIQVMHSLLCDDEPHGLKYIAKEVLGWKWSDFKDTFKLGPGRTYQDELMTAFHTDRTRLVEYAANDAYGTMQAGDLLNRRLESTVTFGGYPYMYNTLGDIFWKTEMPFTRVLYKMERRGVLLDLNYLQSVSDPIDKESMDIEKEWFRRHGSLSISSSDDLIKVLIHGEGLVPLKWTKGGVKGIKKPSMDEEFLAYVAHKSPSAKMALDYRKLKKMKTNFIEGMSKFADPHDRVHARFNQDTARCMPAGELVLTSRGYLPVEQVVVGDKVISHTGTPRAVTDTSVHAPQPIYFVCLSNGLTLRTTGNHEYLTDGGRWVRADGLTPGMVVVTHSEQEKWAPIEQWAPFEVSSWGRVRNTSTGDIRALQRKGEWGHLKVTLYRNGAQRRGPDKRDFSVHRLVLAAFGSRKHGSETRHLNGIAWDNTAGNLLLGTSKENTQDALKHGTLSLRRSGRTTLSETDVAEIRTASSAGQQTSPTARLSFEVAEGIREAHKSGSPTRLLATLYGVSYQAIDRIIKRRAYVRPPPSRAESAKALAEKYGVSEGYIREVQSGVKWKDDGYIEGPKATFSTSTVAYVYAQPPETTYGLTVEEDHSHVTGGIVTHNTGRLTCSAPPLQTIPNPEADEFKIRKGFVARKGFKLICRDFEALEMRVLAAQSGEPDMLKVFANGWDIHMGNASMVFNIPYEDIAKAKKKPKEQLTEYDRECLEYRRRIKVIGFG